MVMDMDNRLLCFECSLKIWEMQSKMDIYEAWLDGTLDTLPRLTLQASDASVLSMMTDLSDLSL
jgi:hypothetical protein